MIRRLLLGLVIALALPLGAAAQNNPKGPPVQIFTNVTVPTYPTALVFGPKDWSAYSGVSIFASRASTSCVNNAQVQVLGSATFAGEYVASSDPNSSVNIFGSGFSGTAMNYRVRVDAANIKIQIAAATAGSSTCVYTIVIVPLVNTPTVDVSGATTTVVGSAPLGTISPVVVGGLTSAGAVDALLVSNTGVLSVAPVLTNTLGTFSIGALNATSAVALAGQRSAGVNIAVGTLDAVLTPELSFDVGSTWIATQFVDPTTRALTDTLTLTSPNSATRRSILVAGGATNVRVRASTYNSGAAITFVVATQAEAVVAPPAPTAVETIACNSGTSPCTITTVVTALNANSGRHGAVLTNTNAGGGQPLLCRYGGTATTTDYHLYIPAQASLSITAGWAGTVSCVCNSGSCVTAVGAY